jgi:hypothetical protein
MIFPSIRWKRDNVLQIEANVFDLAGKLEAVLA